jgi:hypothetical protein
MAKVKVPKKVAGVKVPKKLRKQARKALKMVESPGARDLAMAGLALAAESIVDRAQAEGKARRAGRDMLEQARDGHRQIREAVKRNLERLDLGDILQAAAAEAARRFLEGFEEGQRMAETSDAGTARRRSSSARRQPRA